MVWCNNHKDRGAITNLESLSIIYWPPIVTEIGGNIMIWMCYNMYRKLISYFTWVFKTETWMIQIHLEYFGNSKFKNRTRNSCMMVSMSQLLPRVMISIKTRAVSGQTVKCNITILTHVRDRTIEVLLNVTYWWVIRII